MPEFILEHYMVLVSTVIVMHWVFTRGVDITIDLIDSDATVTVEASPPPLQPARAPGSPYRAPDAPAHCHECGRLADDRAELERLSHAGAPHPVRTMKPSPTTPTDGAMRVG